MNTQGIYPNMVDAEPSDDFKSITESLWEKVKWYSLFERVSSLFSQCEYGFWSPAMAQGHVIKR